MNLRAKRKDRSKDKSTLQSTDQLATKNSSSHGMLFAKTLPIKKISIQYRKDMYGIFQKYYANVSFEQFQADLERKDVVFLLCDKKNQSVQGFSTLLHMTIEKDGKKVQGVFSGDTIIEKKYWGQKTLGVAFLTYLFQLKLKRPFSPLYWFLISKGYKTYLLMANNFPEHFPRYDRPISESHQMILDGFAQAIYPHHYQKEKGIIEFAPTEQKDFLKEDVAPITEDLLQSNPKVAFFVEKNPRWQEGTELACLAKMTWSMPLFYFLKARKAQKLKKKKFFLEKKLKQTSFVK